MPWQTRVPVPTDRLAEATAEHLQAALDEALHYSSIAHLAVSGGRTPWDAFERLAQAPLPWSRIHVWQVDERVAPDGDPARNAEGLRRTLIEPLDLPKEQVHLMEVTHPDMNEAAERYAAELSAVAGGVLHVVHLGLGADGHTASWIPGDPAFDDPDRDVVPTSVEYQDTFRLTLTPRCVNRARYRLVATGGVEKVDAVAKFLARDPSIPASLLSPMTTLLEGC